MGERQQGGIDISEHDEQYSTKKVSPFLADGQGNLVRQAIAGLNIGLYDYLSFNYSGGNLTLISYYQGGAGGTLIASLNLVYDGANNLISLTKT